MKLIRLLVIILSLIAIVSIAIACTSQSTSPATPTTTAAQPTPAVQIDQMHLDSPNGILGSLDYTTEAGINQTAQEMKNLMRESMGARTALGSEADTVFLLIDEAEAAAIANMTERVLTQSTGDLNLAPRHASQGIQMIRHPSQPPGSTAAQYKTMRAFGFLVAAPNLFANGAGKVSPITVEEEIGENGSLQLSLRPTLNGSKMDVDLEMTIMLTKPIQYEERSSGKLQIDLCPDEQGNVPLNLSMKSGFSLNQGGSQWELNVLAVGHVNDEGFLSSMDFDSLSGFAIQTGTSNQYVEMNIGYTLSGLNQGGGTPTLLNFRSEITRISSQTTEAFVKTSAEIFEQTILTYPYFAMFMAQDQWTKGYCVEIRVPDIPEDSKTVRTNSRTSFEATVWHKFDEKELNVPLIATLASGKISIQPVATKIPAPASFTYTAPGETGETAVVHLETLSKRGISKKEVTFLTEAPQLELHFDSLIVSDSLSPTGGSVIKTTQHVRVVVPLHWSEEEQAYIGEAPLEYILFDVPPIIGYTGDDGSFDPCPNEVSASGGIFRVVKLLVDDPYPAEPLPASAPVIELTMDPGDTVESIVPVCPGPAEMPPGFTFPLLTWSQQFSSAHNQELVAVDGPYLIKEWAAGSGDVIATKTYTVNKTTFGILVIQENTTISLVQK